MRGQEEACAIFSRQSGPSSAASSFSNDLKYRFRCPDSLPTQRGISVVISLMSETFPHPLGGVLFTAGLALHSSC